MKKKRLFFSAAVLITAVALIALNSTAVSAALDRMLDTKQNSTLSKSDNKSFASVETLKTQPNVPAATTDEYLAEVMTPNDFEMIYQFFINSKSEATSGTRELSEDEIDRERKLKDQYTYNGLRPINPLPLQAEIYDFYFDLETGTYHYPEREMTDEELLQGIDWIARVNYALSLRHERSQPDAKDINEAEAVNLAKQSVENLFDVDVTPLEVHASYSSDGPAGEGLWGVMFTPYMINTLTANGETFWEYTVVIDSLSGDVLDTGARCSTYTITPIDETAKKDILEDKSWVEVATSIITNKNGETRKITSAAVMDASYLKDGELIVDPEANAKMGRVDVLIQLEDGTSYIVTLLYPDQTLRCVVYQQSDE